ncbi:MAG: hypothetical protein HC898_05735 [Phycisphaerales bacterium]|nr:hypothetical protein [Phycisphaerales bacterium]
MYGASVSFVKPGRNFVPMTQSPRGSSRQWRKSWRLGDHAQRTQLIVDVSLVLLEMESAEGVTTRKVAAMLGVGAMTLYTYVKGQPDLRLRMIQRGFEMMRMHCDSDVPNTTMEHWRRGAANYINFAVSNPRLYELMFSQPIAGGQKEADAVAKEFEPFFQEIRDLLALRGLSEAQLDARARTVAGRLWIGMHGLASLAISGRLDVLKVGVDRVLDDLLEHLGLEEMIAGSISINKQGPLLDSVG